MLPLDRADAGRDSVPEFVFDAFDESMPMRSLIHTAYGCSWDGLWSRLHAALDLVNPALDLRDSEAILAIHFSSRSLAIEHSHDYGGFTLGGPSFDGVVIVYSVF